MLHAEHIFSKNMQIPEIECYFCMFSDKRSYEEVFIYGVGRMCLFVFIFHVCASAEGKAGGET